MNWETVILVGFLAEAFAEIVSESLLLERFREWAADRSDLLGNGISCPSCVSAWPCLAWVACHWDGFAGAAFTFAVSWFVARFLHEAYMLLHSLRK
jgi:hypothetical protein